MPVRRTLERFAAVDRLTREQRAARSREQIDEQSARDLLGYSGPTRIDVSPQHPPVEDPRQPDTA